MDPERTRDGKVPFENNSELQHSNQITYSVSHAKINKLNTTQGVLQRLRYRYVQHPE